MMLSNELAMTTTAVMMITATITNHLSSLQHITIAVAAVAVVAIAVVLVVAAVVAVVQPTENYIRNISL